MPKGVVAGTDSGGYVEQAGVDPALLAALAGEMAPLRTGVGSRVEVLQELMAIKAAICTWHRKEVGQVLQEASAYSARLTELWTELRLLESSDRAFTQLRTMQVQPVLDEVDRQYRFATSRIALMRQDIDLSR
jgi:hypothetical protein